MKTLIALWLALATAAVAQNTPAAASFKIDAAFPGGNIQVSKIEGDTVELGPDQRENIIPWFYWYFRVAGAGSRKLTFVFPKNRVGVRGPGISLDGGQTWKWLGADSVV